MARRTQRRRVGYKLKLLLWFMPISLFPLTYVGYSLVNISQESLRKEILSNQESLAAGFADNTSKYVTTFKNVLVETAGIEEFASMEALKQQQYLNRVMQVHMAIIELSVIKAGGQEILRVGRFLGPNPEMRNFSSDDLFMEAIERGQRIGRLERFQGLYPTLNIAVAVVDRRAQPAKPVGVLAAKVSLNGLSQMLSMEFPQGGKATAAVVGPAPEGFLIAHSSYKEVFKPNARLNPEILKYISTQRDEKGSGEISLADDAKMLGSYADVPELGWQVYVQQPLEAAFKASKEMKDRIYRWIVFLAVAVLILSLIVARGVTEPISALQKATEKLAKLQDLDDEIGAVMPDDEIGDLFQDFQDMSESLKEAIGQRDHANRELDKYRQSLEKRLAARVRELQAAQEENLKNARHSAIGKMASVVSHEIRNPLAVMKNSIYFIKMKLGAEADPKLAKHIKIIESEIDQANGIITEILDFARERDPKPEQVQLNAFLEELVSIYPFPSHIRVEKAFDPREVVVNIDTTEIRQAVRNLIGNGIEVMPNGGAIRIATSVGAEWVVIGITDTGTGIPPEIRDKLFMEFFTTKARGTGLGLAVVKKVMDRHKGKVELESEVGKGTTFKLFLPLTPAAAPVRS